MKSEAGCYHIPVLLRESVEALAIRPDGIYVDLTFGGGGHSRAILERLGAEGQLFGFDQDEDAMANDLGNSRFTFVRSNFRWLRHWLRYYGVERLDGILADLGVSSHHFDAAERGFSFREDGPLDMRMNRLAQLTAADVVNTYAPERLARLFWLYGELKQGRQLSQALCKQRERNPLSTIGELYDAVKPCLARAREKKDLTKVFQALRIEVNHEMAVLEQMLLQTPHLLKPGGRLVVLTYHSLEDRMVKNIMRSGNMEGRVEQDFYGNPLSPFRLITSRPILPTDEEQERNPRSRSAKLRVASRV